MARKAPGKTRPKGKGSAARKKAGQTAYQKRLRDYQRKHPGWRADPHWKQKARGHVEREHIGRRERELARLVAWAEQQAARFRGGDAEAILEKLMVRYRAEGIGLLNRIEQWVAEKHAEYMAQEDRDRKGRRPSLGINIWAMADAQGLEPETFGYH